jgi:hypothetical protein
MIEIIGLIILISEHQTFFELFHQMIPQVLVTIVLNLMKTKQEEFDLIEEDPQEFVNLALDTCDK